MARTLPPPSAETKKAQLALPFDDGPRVAAIEVDQRAGHTEVEVILPRAAARQLTAERETDDDPRTDGQLEHAYLSEQAARYEDRCFKAAGRFSAAAVLTVLARAGVDLSGVVLAKFGLPEIEDTRLLPGMLGAITVVYAFVTLYYGLRIRQHRPQRQLRLLGWSAAGFAAEAMLVLGVLLLVTLLAIAVYVSFADILFMATYLFDHNVYTLEGWDFHFVPPTGP